MQLCFIKVGAPVGCILSLFVVITYIFINNKCYESRGWPAQWKNVCFVKRFSIQTMVQISPYAKFLSCAIYSQMHDPEASKHVGRNLATSQSELKNLLLSNMQPLSEREHSPNKLVLWYGLVDGHTLSFILLRNFTQPTLQPTDELSAIRQPKAELLIWVHK